MAQVWFIACVAGFLCCLSVLNACEWDPNTDLNQGLDISSFIDGAPDVTELPEISDPEQCQKACCETNDCQLALIGTPADGLPQCRLVNCMKDGVDLCVLSHSTQFQVYRKIQDKADEEPYNEAEARVVNNTDYCRFASAVGNCRAAFPRFYYDVTQQTCKPFIYGGCGGNNNNFNTKEECEASCGGVTGPVLVDTHSVAQRSRLSVPGNKNDVEPNALPEMTPEEYQEKCLASAQTGLCRASIRHFYYNSGACQPFTYGGCGGNQNNYETEELCMTTCTVKVIPKKQAPVVPSTNNIHSFEETCTVPFETGLCRASLQMYYFDPSTESCKPFIYGGCGGNLNRYSNEEECMSACSGKDGHLDTFGHHKRSRWTPAFFLVATLAIMSALLLVGLILISVRRNSHRRFRILDDKEVLLPEEEQLSNEKLPKDVSV